MGNKIKGGLADKMSLEDIARKHSAFIGTIKKEYELGVKVEMEHTNDKDKAKEIAMDHLVELPDYYSRLEKMEDEGESKLKEPKEITDAGSSGSFEAGMSMPIMKRDIQNFKLKSSDINEMDGIADMAYDAPIGTKKKNPLAIDKKTKSASITAASTDGMVAMKKGWPKFGGPDAKYVEIDKKCKTFPYCNQGDDNNIHLKEAIEQAAKKYGITTKQVKEILLKESKQLTKR